ncbi:PQQ-binding-like beta-propeller repeat protein [Nocardia asteroides]|uniref:outer membrane protein assembly factor BamB family protein n=1 Tax=Nocardia asteroides TaxID=1824 RepID=UPI001E30CC57|nr:PQQ-binding-like beta-propeller repeat protein [Nocardia asteroides]UGT57108.1 PQQ-like beta-propeller repeat protein [Nocardia asteroides]
MVGAVLLAGGVGLALYSQFVAAPIPVPFDDDYPRTRDFPLHLVRGSLVLAGAVVLIGAVVLVGTAVLNRRHSGDERTAGFTAGGVLAMVAVLIGGIAFAVTAHIPSTYQRLTSIFAATPRVPSAIAALVLVLLGAVLVFVLVATPTVARPRAAVLATAVVVGVVPVLGAAGIAVRLGDDATSIDRVTAEPSQETGAPTVLGPERFRLRLPVDPDQPNARIVTTGNGFVVSTRDGITSHDGATGTARWHYRRLGVRSDTVGNVPMKTVALRGENAVLTYWEKQGWLAFDTDTGELLWTATDLPADQDSIVRGNLLAFTSDYGTVTRVDARTGRTLWTSPRESSACSSTDRHVVATMTAIYRVASCGYGDEAAVVVTELDAKSGEIHGRRGFPAPSRRSPCYVEARVLDSGYVVMSCGHDGGTTEILLPPTGLLASAVVVSDDYVGVLAADSDILISSYLPDEPVRRWEVLSAADGRPMAELDRASAGEDARTTYATAMLAEQIVTVTRQHDAYTLRTWDKRTGLPGPARSVSVPPETSALRWTTLGGSLVLIATGPDYRDIEIIGFG